MPSQTFTTSGTWTAPGALAAAPDVQAQGVGGNGANHPANNRGGGGGGAGAYAAEPSLGGVTAGVTTLTITIPAAGSGSAVTVTGGSVTVSANAGASGSSSTGGSGGAAGTNTVAFKGGNGGGGVSSGSDTNAGGGGGGGSGGSTAAGGNGGSGGNASGGAGGTAGTGSPAGAAGGAGAATSSSAGGAGTVPGSGGGGGCGGNSGGSNGAAGAGGQVIITWTEAVTGTVDVAVAPIAVSVAGNSGATTGTVSVAVAPIAVAATGAGGNVTGTAAVAVAPIAVAATGAEIFAATVNVAMAPIAVAATGAGGNVTGTVSVAVAPIAVAATGAGGNTTGTVGVAVAPIAVAATDSEKFIATMSVAVAPIAVAATGAVLFPFPQFPLGTKVELLLNGAWTDITTLVYARDDIVISPRGRPDETQNATPSQMTLTLNNQSGCFSPDNQASPYYPYFARNTQIRVSVNSPSATLDSYSGYRFWGECSSIVPGWDKSGNDRWVTVTAAGPLRRYSQGNATIGSALRRYYARLSGNKAPYGYWTCEDPSGSTQFASFVSGVPAMSWTGSPGLAADSAFGGSDAIAGINSSTWHGETAAAETPPGSGSETSLTPGTYTWTCPPGVTTVTITEAIGGGGGGGANGPAKGGGGGGGGGSAAGTVDVTPGVTYTYTIGAGGQPGTTEGTQGQAGGATSWTGDSSAITGAGGAPGLGGDAGTGGSGGAAGTGGYAGGSGAPGLTSASSVNTDTLTANAGASGGGNGGTAGQITTGWLCPLGVTSADVVAGGGGGGGEGGGCGGGYGGGGGGGGGLSSGTILTTGGNNYTFAAGSGGNGNGGNPGAHGDAGAASSVTGDSGSSVSAGGGAEGSGTGGGGGGGGGTTANGSTGGAGAKNGAYGGGGGGGAGGGGDSGSGGNASNWIAGGSGGDGGGGGWGATTLGSASGSTAGGTGGSNPGFAAGGGGGGGGAVTAGTGKAAGGGGAGWIQWTYTIPDQPAGGGGGSSAGTSSAGNGGAGSSGGSPVTGGGAGGNQGTAGGAPGGGGGGGYPSNTLGGAATPPGAGAPGYISFEWSGGTVSPVAANIIRFLLDVTAESGIANIIQVSTYGTVANLYIEVASSDILLQAYDSSGDFLWSTSSCALGLAGQPMLIDVELTANSDGTSLTWTVAGIIPGASSPVATYTGTASGMSLGYVSDIYVDPAASISFVTGLGHIAVQTYADDLADLGQVIAGYNGELAADRLARLAAEEGLGFELTGLDTDTPQMGPQTDDTFPNVLQFCEDLDRGQLYETRDAFGLGYRTRQSMQGQSPVIILDYSAATLADKVEPTSDDQYTRNDLAISRNNGSTAILQQLTGPMSILPPPNGVGDYVYTLTVYAYEDSQLVPLTTWMLSVGTVPGGRYPVITLDMTRPEVAGLFSQIPAIDVGDFVQVINPPSWLTLQPISQLAWGFTENINAFLWTISWNAVPEAPYSEGDPPVW